MKVKALIEKLKKLDQNAEVGTFAKERYDFVFTPLTDEIIVEEGIEMHEDFQGQGRKRFKDWVILFGYHQEWHPHYTGEKK